MRLKDYLAKEKLTPPQFARLIGVSAVSVWRYLETGRFPQPDVLRAILAATKGRVTPNDFLNGAK